ncbi:MAG: anthranilate synthase component I [bacterium]
MYYPNFSEFQNLTKKGSVVPVYTSYLADLLTPVFAFLRLRTVSEKAFLLESVEGGEKTARYSFLGCQPFSTIQYSDNKIEAERNGKRKYFEGNIFEYLKLLMHKYNAVHLPGLPRFTGGAVGYFGYETVQLLEKVPKNKTDDIDFPQAMFMLFDTVLVFDHLTHQIYIISNVFLDNNIEPLRMKYEEAIDKIETIKKELKKEVPPMKNCTSISTEVSSNLTKSDFYQAVSTVKGYIEAGDIFQVVLSQKFQKEINLDPFNIYRALRVINPSPYLYFIKINEMCIIGSSPELLVRVEGGVVEVRPIAGTRPRGKDEKDDQRFLQELRNDEKEIAEHIMLVDLGRNDIGRVSQYGSVEVTELMTTEKYSHVMHLVSNIRGKLKAELSALDALKACFPAGTVSGAPKIRAMEIISELEPTCRGVYAGALGYLDFSGNLDTCIAIRTIVTKGNQAYFQAGAGIVADSIAEREYLETLEKASALKAAIEFAERGLE